MGFIGGKLIAGLLGLVLAGPVGALIGLFVGHWFDRGLQQSFGFGNPQRVAEIQREFFRASFLLLGQMAKADGRISEAEIAHAEHIMRQHRISGAQRDEAIALFKQGAAPDFDMTPVVGGFNRLCAGHRQVKQMLLAFLVTQALADGELHPAELQLLQQVAALLGYQARDFERLVRMMEAQQRFHGAGHGQGADAGRASTGQQLEDAYRALGVNPDCSDRELKLAYRRLMSENHPDKLIAKGVPEQMVKLATERSQDIQAAYELARRSRRN